MKQKPVFETDDGKWFFTEEEAAAHEASLKLDADLDKYLTEMSAQGIPESVARSRRNAAKHFLAWQADGTIKMPKERKKA